MRTVAPAWTEPFPGLRPFDSSERNLFFGRDQVVEDILGRVLDARFAAVVGSSGSGKSSTVRAGVLPRMQDADDPWTVVVLRPGTRPLDALAEALKEQDVDDAQTTIRGSSLGLLAATAELPGQLLVVVDQFEDLFRPGLAQDRDEPAMFVSALLEAAADPRGQVGVLITMRSDFIGECEVFRGLPEAVNRGMYLMPRMTRNELRDIIEGPAGVAGVDVRPRLVQAILNDAVAESFSLGLVQLALQQTWREWRVRADGGAMDLPHYERVGRLRGSLEYHAEVTFAALHGVSESVVRRVFVSLAEQTPAGAWFRVPRPLAEVVALADADLTTVIRALHHYEGEQFLIVSIPGIALQHLRTVTEFDAARGIVDLTSDLLITRWERFAEWLRFEALDRQKYIRLTETADMFAAQRARRLTEPELGELLEWRDERKPSALWGERIRPGFEQAMRFLDHSADAEQQLRAHVERRRRFMKAVRLSAVLLLFVLLALAFLR
jgi:hypothetical protein